MLRSSRHLAICATKGQCFSEGVPIHPGYAVRGESDALGAQATVSAGPHQPDLHHPHLTSSSCKQHHIETVVKSSRSCNLKQSQSYKETPTFTPDIVRQLVLLPYAPLAVTTPWRSARACIRIMDGPSHPGHGVYTRPARCTTGFTFRTESAECIG